jgi:hypothetical protein
MRVVKEGNVAFDAMADREGEGQEADFVTIVSSEMIAEVMEQHFNKNMYKKTVKIVDLKSTETGYMFSLAFVPTVIGKKQTLADKVIKQMNPVSYSKLEQKEYRNGIDRDSKGKFTCKKKEMV